MNNEEKDLIIKLLTVLFPTAKIYLFGSRARGDFKPGSDMDLAIDIGKEMTIHEIARAKRILDDLYFTYMFDVVDMQKIPKEMKEIILREGILWKK